MLSYLSGVSIVNKHWGPWRLSDMTIHELCYLVRWVTPRSREKDDRMKFILRCLKSWHRHENSECHRSACLHEAQWLAQTFQPIEMLVAGSRSFNTPGAAVQVQLWSGLPTHTSTFHRLNCLLARLTNSKSHGFEAIARKTGDTKQCRRWDCCAGWAEALPESLHSGQTVSACGTVFPQLHYCMCSSHYKSVQQNTSLDTQRVSLK